MPSLGAAMADGRGGEPTTATTIITIKEDDTAKAASKTKKTTLLSLLRAKSERSAEAEEKVEWVRSQIIGGDAELDTPFGRRALVYADHTASGRGLRYVENYLLTHVLPFYGNTHTEDSYVGSRTTRTLSRASNYIKCCTGARDDGVALLFCGSGTTAAIKRLQEATGIAAPPGVSRATVVSRLRPEERWVVFVGPYEHHSNLLSWRQSLADVVEVGAAGGEDGGGGLVDLAALRRALGSPEYADRPMLGSFSACSNVTGILTDTRAIARVLHQHGAFACFDFAAASAPYVEIDMRPGEMDGYDAIFLSPHKFPGGAPGTPGILLMSHALYVLGARSLPPSTCGGGTVAYVNGASECDTVYLDGMEEREAAGTPPVAEAVRAALAFWVKERVVGLGVIAVRERAHADAAMRWLLRNPHIEVLGDVKARRLPIFSFLVYPGSGGGAMEIRTKRLLPLHGRFVARLMNDLFGIQARGGCACAGPYGHALLGVGHDLSLRIRSAILKGYHGVKPGWMRVSFAYYMPREEFRFILAAIDFVAEHGHRFLPLYAFDWATGNWTFRRRAVKHHLIMEELPRLGGVSDVDEARRTTKEELKTNDDDKFKSYLELATKVALSLPDTSCDPQQVASRLPEGIDPDIVLFRV